MNEPILDSQSFCQVALVVRDIEHSRHRYAALFGVAPPNVIITDPAEKARTRYRGQPTLAQAKLAFFDLGHAQLELIEPIGGPSIWQEHLDRHGESVHHIAFRVPAMKPTLDSLAARGAPTVQTGEFTGGRYAYVDASATLGTLLELLEVDHAR
jgi:catechol 2,3-dioxygenase-like lactoylglutathione lyase family enzyme